MENELNLTCECAAEMLRVSYWKEHNNPIFIFTLFTCSPYTFSLWDRIKFLFRGHDISHDVVLDEESISKLIEFLNSKIQDNE